MLGSCLERPMTENRTDSLLNDLLARWHLHEIRTPPATGFPKTSACCKLYRASRQYDDWNHALDSDAENDVLEAVGHCIDRVQQPFRTAIYINARNLATGVSVWTSLRLPADEMQRAQMVADARDMLLIELSSAGIA